MNQIFPHYSINNKSRVCVSPQIRRFHVEQTGNNFAVSCAVFRGSFFQCNFYAPLRQWLVLLNASGRLRETESTAVEAEHILTHSKLKEQQV